MSCDKTTGKGCKWDEMAVPGGIAYGYEHNNPAAWPSSLRSAVRGSNATGALQSLNSYSATETAEDEIVEEALENVQIDVSDELIAAAAGEKPDVVDFEEFSIDQAIQDSDAVFDSIMSRVDESIKEMDVRVNETITSALENSGMPQGTLNLMERTFAERNRSQGRGGGLAQTTAGLGMRDASLQSIQAFTQLGAGRVDAATNRSIGIGQQALGQAMQIQDTDIMRKQATAQSRANIEAAGDPFAQLKIQLETTQAGLNSQVANLTLGQQLSNLYPTPQMNGGASGPSGMQQAGAGLMAGGGALMSSGLVAAGPIGLGVMAGGALISALG